MKVFYIDPSELTEVHPMRDATVLQYRQDLKETAVNDSMDFLFSSMTN